MRKKAFAAMLVIAAAFFVVCVSIFGKTEIITRDDLSNISDEEVKQKIARIMLADSGREAEVTPEEIVEVAVFYGDITGSGQREDAVIDAYFGPRYTLISAYKGDKKGDFTYLDEMGVFFDSRNPRTVYMQNEKRDAVFINEEFNYKIGAFEKIEYSQGFLWDDSKNGFGQIFSDPVSIRTDWNTAWNGDGTEAPSDWERVTQSTKSVFENGDNPVIKNVYSHEYLTSSDNQSKNIPLDDTYTLQEERQVERTYYWNDEWRAFIADEMIENSTGDRVAITFFWSDLPYSLAEYSDDENKNTPEYANLARIKRKDGSIDIVNINELSEIRENNGAVDGLSA